MHASEHAVSTGESGLTGASSPAAPLQPWERSAGGDAARPLFVFPTLSYVLTNAFPYGTLVLLSCNNSTEMNIAGIVMLL